ncbi:hypothetical protein GJU40_19815 [Bacillus lacus]|uniref:Uncharacterized protein n=1 Tax=Metabacillus lacus TaxID=1983721 RepID=A0A7X2J2W3_9BACI|nr:hypothetical protein [Metabacillus lacus]MRX74370.1 hypothetical protein [Metabacillus lacus]
MKLTNIKKIILPALTVVMSSIILVQNYSINEFKKENVKVSDEKDYKTISVDGKYKVYKDVNELVEDTELILLGSPTEDFSKRKHVEVINELDNSTEDAYTLTNFKVDRVIKSPSSEVFNKNNIIEFVEPVGLMQDSNKIKVKVVLEEYSELKEGSKYIIFLKKNAYGKYSLIFNNLGKYNIDNTDPTDMGLNNHNKEKKDRFKKEIIKL